MGSDNTNTSRNMTLKFFKRDHSNEFTGILPCTLRTRNYFEAVFSLSKAIRKLSSSTDTFFSGLIVQRAIFENGCRQLILLVAPTRQDVQDMFEDPNHYIWTDEAADQYLGQRLASTRSSCSRMLQYIQDNLGTMNQELRPLASRHSGDWKAKVMPKPMWRTKASLNVEIDLCRFLKDLGQYNDLFRCCILQVVPPRINDLADLLQLSTLEKSLRQNEVQAAKERTRDAHLRCVQGAFQDFFEALFSKWPCQHRFVHSHSVYLDLDSLKNFEKGSNGHIRFDLAVSISPHEETTWVVIHSTQSKACCCEPSDRGMSLGSLYGESQDCMETISAAAEDVIHSPIVKLYHSKQGSVRSSSGIKLSSSSQQSEFTDLSQTDDLCTYLQKSSWKWRYSMDLKETSCLGYMKTSGIFTHLTFHAQNKRKMDNDPFSLDCALLQSQDPQFAIEDRLRLASLLATAMLQLHATPWLLEGWRSKDILFFQCDQQDGKTGLQKPYLRRHIQGNRKEDLSYGKLNFTIINTHLFSLCLILLELAFSSPLRNLQLPERIAKDLTVSEREDLTMTWLVETVSREVGSRYAKVVRYCFFHSVGSQELPSLEQSSRCHQKYPDIVDELNRCLLAWSL